MKTRLALLLVLAGLFQVCAAQEEPAPDRFSGWLPFQAVPGFTWYSSAGDAGFGFEWEMTPVLYSFGMNKQISPWYAFIAEPPARFTGSIEATVAMQLFTTKIGTSHFGFSGSLMGYIPLIERGEYLTANVGVGTYRIENRQPVFGIVGVSTLFGFLHLNMKHSPNERIWITSLEFRFF